MKKNSMKTKKDRLDYIVDLIRTNDRFREHFTRCVEIDPLVESFEELVELYYSNLTNKILDEFIVRLKNNL